MHRNAPQSTRFKPGQSGNPNGRPKRLNHQDLLKILQQIIKLYSDATAVDKTISHPAQQKLIKLNKIIQTQ